MIGYIIARLENARDIRADNKRAKARENAEKEKAREPNSQSNSQD